MPNEEYQRLLRSTAGELRERLPGSGGGGRDVARLIADLSDEEVLRAIRDLGGHDLADLLEALARADAVTDRPSVIFAFTIKAWRLATQGHPANHSALLSAAQMEELASATGADASDPWARFADGSPEAELCRTAAMRLARDEVALTAAPVPPPDLGRVHAGRASTQQAFGRFFVDLSHNAPEVARTGCDGQPGCGVLDEPRRVDQPRRDLASRRPDRLVRRRHRHARALARVRARAAHRARDRGGKPGGAARRAGSDVVARRAGAAADRDAVRPVRRPRARAVVVRSVRGRPVDSRRHSVRGDARARGRRAPVDHHAVDRTRATPVHRLGTGLRAGSRVDPAGRAGATRASRRHIVLFPLDRRARSIRGSR